MKKLYCAGPSIPSNPHQSQPDARNLLPFNRLKPLMCASRMLFFAIILLIVHCSLLIAQQPTQEWVARYHTPQTEHDRFEAMVLDKYGNAYLTGWTSGSVNGNDIITVKINSAGQIVWARVYNSGGTDFNDIAKAIAVDDSDNVCVTGFTGFSTGPYDIITIKYDSTGNTRWLKKYDSGGTDGANAIKIDKTHNIYITGTAGGRAITIKYNSLGDTLWIRKYMGGISSYSICLDIDSSKNVYAGGSVVTNYARIMLIKYDMNGNPIWTNIYDNGGASSPFDISVDRSGSGAITGTFTLLPSGYEDYYTVRFTASGSTLWQRYYNGPGNFIDYAQSVSIDNQGFTYVTGYSWGVNSMDYATIKYDLQGDSAWVRRYNGPADNYDQAYSICVDTLGNCYVTGASFDVNSGDDYASIKYSPSGTQLWLVRYNGPANSGDGAGSVILGPNSTVYVGGESYGINTGKDLAIVKYDQIIGIAKNSNEFPTKYELFQNYPNPFNAITKIKVAIPKKSLIQIKIFDVLGRIEETLINKELSASNYEIAFDGSKYSSGVYFYQLAIDGYIFDSKKMVIIK